MKINYYKNSEWAKVNIYLKIKDLNYQNYKDISDNK